MEITVEKMSPQDRDAMVSIFREGAQSGDLVLDTDDPGTKDITAGQNLVARAKGRVIGWATLDPARGGRGTDVATVGVFVSPEYRRMGLGRTLLNAATDIATSNGISKVVTGIAPKNVPALLMHKKCGFKAVRMLRNAGVAKGQWQDAVLLQREC
jgi:L-amino acid N-acyltransferase YncA